MQTQEVTQQLIELNSGTQVETFKTSTSNPNFIPKSHPLNTSTLDNPVERQRIASVRTQNSSSSQKNSTLQVQARRNQLTHQFKTATESTESRERNGTTGTSGNDSESQVSYMRHTSNSEKRRKARSKTQMLVKSSIMNRKSLSQTRPANEPKIKHLASTYMKNIPEDRQLSPIPQSVN